MLAKFVFFILQFFYFLKKNNPMRSSNFCINEHNLLNLAFSNAGVNRISSSLSSQITNLIQKLLKKKLFQFFLLFNQKKNAKKML